MNKLLIKEYRYPSDYSDLKLLIEGHQSFIRNLEPHIAVKLIHNFDLRKYLEHFFDNKFPKAIYMAYMNNEVAGYISIFVSLCTAISVYREHRLANLNELFVVEKFRKMNIATELIEKSKSWAKANSCEYIQVGYSVKNVDAEKLYNNRIGFSKTGQISILKL